MPAKSTSPKGRAFLEREEGVVLRAYRDAVGVWTIGAGLTAASGVVTPKHGMVITREEAERLLALALQRNYEPAVVRAMPDASQAEFDGAVSFHWNTGAIGKASWVKAWAKRDWWAVHDRLLRWSKGGGKVLPGLRKRREREFLLMRDGVYSGLVPTLPAGARAAKFAVQLTVQELIRVREGFSTLGYDPGTDPRIVAVDAVSRFQLENDLTVDGIVGRATLSTLQRRLDARSKTGKAVALGGVGSAATLTPPPSVDLPDYTLWIVVAFAALELARQAWIYRDVIAAKLQHRLPGLAAWLRRI